MNFTRVTLRDAAIDGIEGATLLVPDGWRLDGGFAWTPLLSMQAGLPLHVSDPRTGAAVSMLPGHQFVWPMQPMPGMQPGANWLGSILLPPPGHPAECVHQVFMPGPLQHLQGARLVGSADMPELAAEAARDVPHMTVHATRLRYAFGWGGRPWEEEVYLSVSFDRPNGYLASWWCNAHSLRAPAGTLDGMAPLLTAAVLSLRVGLDWSALLEHARGRFREAMRKQQSDPDPRGLILPPAQPLDPAWRRQLAEIREAHRPAWERWQASQDRRHAELARAVGGLEAYTDPFEPRPVRLPRSMYGYWAGSDGRIAAAPGATSGMPADGTTEWRRMSGEQPGPWNQPGYPAWPGTAGTIPAMRPPAPGASAPPLHRVPGEPRYPDGYGSSGTIPPPPGSASPAAPPAHPLRPGPTPAPPQAPPPPAPHREQPAGTGEDGPGSTDAEMAKLETWTSELDAEFERMLKEITTMYEHANRIAARSGSTPGASYGIILKRLNEWHEYFRSHQGRAFASEASRRSLYGQSLTRILEQVENRIEDMAKQWRKFQETEAREEADFQQGLRDATTASLEKRQAMQQKFSEDLQKARNKGWRR